MADVADGDHSNAITSECCDPFGHRLHNADDSCHQGLVHIQITRALSVSPGLQDPGRDMSIPACAGKPWRRLQSEYPSGVDPRVRGEARRGPEISLHTTGRSPRARGSLRTTAPDRAEQGSIPACAGKPGSRSLSTPLHRVDPRVRGEATVSGTCPPPVEGRSPRARGSLVIRLGDATESRSIPACAGKP